MLRGRLSGGVLIARVKCGGGGVMKVSECVLGSVLLQGTVGGAANGGAHDRRSEIPV